MKKFLRYMFGYLKIRITGDFAERFLNMCSYHKIELWNLKPDNLSYEMNISVSGFRKLKPILKKTKTKVIIKERYGLPFFMHRYRNRQCFFLCGMTTLFLLYVSTFFVWSIQFDGNLYCTDEVLTEGLKEEGIIPGVRKEKIDCAEIAQYLREKYDNITWASVYKDGTKLKIRIKENNEILESVNEEIEAGESIFAECDATIVSIVTRKGVPAVHEGDDVKEGDLLVSGELEIKNDAGEVTEYEYVSADAEIIAQVEIEYEDILPLTYMKKEFTGQESKKIWLETEKATYLLGGTKIKYKEYTTETKNRKIFSGIKLGIKNVKEYKNITKKYTEKEYRELLTANFLKFCEDLEKKGVQILENSVKIYTESERVSARGTITIYKEFGMKNSIEKKQLQEGKIYGNP